MFEAGLGSGDRCGLASVNNLSDIAFHFTLTLYSMNTFALQEPALTLLRIPH